jgi:hypothetical protein
MCFSIESPGCEIYLLFHRKISSGISRGKYMVKGISLFKTEQVACARNQFLRLSEDAMAINTCLTNKGFPYSQERKQRR